MAEVIVIISPNGEMRVEGEGFETKALKKELEKIGEVTERHVGSEHVKESAPQVQQRQQG